MRRRRRRHFLLALVLLCALHPRGTATATNTTATTNTTNTTSQMAPVPAPREAPAVLPACNNQGLWAMLPVPTYICNNATVTEEVYRQFIASDYTVRARQQRRALIAQLVVS